MSRDLLRAPSIALSPKAQMFSAKHLTRQEVIDELHLLQIRDFNLSGYADGTVEDITPLLARCAKLLEEGS
jgi:hypothetical protein